MDEVKAIAAASDTMTNNGKLGWAWVGLCAAFGLHIVDEAATDFLSVYNPTVKALRSKLSFFPMPTFEFREWLIGLIAADVALFGLSPLVFRDARAIKPLAYFFSAIMLANGVGHVAVTVTGRTVESVPVPRPAPGFWSSPLLLMAAAYLLKQLRA